MPRPLRTRLDAAESRVPDPAPAHRDALRAQIAARLVALAEGRPLPAPPPRPGPAADGLRAEIARRLDRIASTARP